MFVLRCSLLLSVTVLLKSQTSCCLCEYESWKMQLCVRLSQPECELCLAGIPPVMETLLNLHVIVVLHHLMLF